MNNEWDKDIGIRISDLRRSHNMTQAVLAEKLDVTPKHISHIERGCATVTVKNLIAIGKIFNTSLDYILLGKSNDKALALLPDTIIEILYSDNQKEIERLTRYLQIYEELYKREK